MNETLTTSGTFALSNYICMHILRTHFEMQLGQMCYAVYYAVRVSITKAFIIIIKHLTYYYKT